MLISVMLMKEKTCSLFTIHSVAKVDDMFKVIILIFTSILTRTKDGYWYLDELFQNMKSIHFFQGAN